MDPGTPTDPVFLAAQAGGVRRLARSLIYDTDCRGDDRVGDVVQETMLVALRSHAAPKKSPVGWLYGVARNVARGLARADRRRGERERRASRPEAVPGTSEVVAALEEQRRVLLALEALEEPYRTALFLRFLQGLPPRAIAARLSIPVETAKSHVKRGLVRLRESLDAPRGGNRAAWMAALLPLATKPPPPTWVPVAATSVGVVAAAIVGMALLRGNSPAVAVPAPAPGAATAPVVLPPPADDAVPAARPAEADAPVAHVPETPAPGPLVVPATVPPREAPRDPPTPLAQGPSAPPASPDAIPPSKGSTPAADVPVDSQTGDPAAPRPEAPRGPGGMVYVDPGPAREATIGTKPADVVRLVGSRKDVLLRLAYETPQHKVALQPFFMDATEVSNAQYLRFLDHAARTTYRTGSSSLSNLLEVGSFFVFGDAKAAEAQHDDRTWGQLYELNKAVLEASMPELKGQKAKWKLASLPADVELVVFRRRLPEHWFASSAVLEGEAAPDMPVRSVSYLDASAFSEWAGKHVPTEEEWEWAARGPHLFDYPWGNDWAEGTRPDGKRIVERRCNWLDLGVENAGHEPTTLPVGDLPEGRSWCGCYHMLGNVAEWTSSWFNPYPGWVAPGWGVHEQERFATYYGQYVRVIRGGSLADRERLVLRLPARNFEGNGRLGPPVPENRFTYVGFRCASYLVPGLDRLEPAVARLLRPQKIRREQVATERFAGSVAVHHVAAGQPAKDHVFVTGGSSAVLLAPMASLSARLRPDERPRGHTPKEILESAREEEPVVLGVFHTDVGIDKARVAAPEKPWHGRRRPEPPTADGKIAPDSYLVGLWFKKIALFRGNLDFVGFIADATAEQPSRDGAPPGSSITVEPDADLVRCSFWIPVGGRGTDAGEGIRFAFTFSTEAGALERAGSWR